MLAYTADIMNLGAHQTQIYLFLSVNDFLQGGKLTFTGPSNCWNKNLEQKLCGEHGCEFCQRCKLD